MIRKRLSQKPAITLLICAMITGLFSGCSVISRDIRQEATAEVNFASLKRNTNAYTGKTVILGGYILETRNLADETRLTVLQAPLDISDKPAGRDRSEGRFLVVHKGFLDPVIYEKDRKITVAGKITGMQSVQINQHESALPVLHSREIHLWQEPKAPRKYYYDPFYPWPDPYFRDPYFRHWRHPYFYR
ncbi:MAG: Slp family lipoprotein [Desulfobacterales bacterium]|nr:Slp family lipoprotein [Desulfobacterales bacterium]